ncbi:MAG: sulfite exporter TauE/SafE family protein [Nitrospinota bacterium]
MPWWGLPLLLFFVAFFLGMLAVLGGVGGGVLFVPIVSGFFPFHFDFVRGGGLLIALSGALAASPRLLSAGLADLRLALPLCLIASLFSIAGAVIGLALPTNLVQVLLGGTIIVVSFIMVKTKYSANRNRRGEDLLGNILKLSGIYREESTKEQISWKAQNTVPGLVTFSFVGLIAGMFGLGAGWANVPVLNIMMGIPIKVAVGTSKFIISVTDTSAVWVYLNSGAIFPVIVTPAVVGMMLGTRIGVNMLKKIRPGSLRYFVIVILFFAGLRTLVKGFGI